MTHYQNSIVPHRLKNYRPSPAPRRRRGHEDHIFAALLPSVFGGEDFAPEGRHDWGRLVLHDADLFSPLHEDAR